jgi:hypothetical protein
MIWYQPRYRTLRQVCTSRRPGRRPGTVAGSPGQPPGRPDAGGRADPGRFRRDRGALPQDRGLPGRIRWVVATRVEFAADVLADRYPPRPATTPGARRRYPAAPQVQRCGPRPASNHTRGPTALPHQHQGSSGAVPASRATTPGVQRRGPGRLGRAGPGRAGNWASPLPAPEPAPSASHPAIAAARSRCLRSGPQARTSGVMTRA